MISGSRGPFRASQPGFGSIRLLLGHPQVLLGLEEDSFELNSFVLNSAASACDKGGPWRLVLQLPSGDLISYNCRMSAYQPLKHASVHSSKGI